MPDVFMRKGRGQSARTAGGDSLTGRDKIYSHRDLTLRILSSDAMRLLKRTGFGDIQEKMEKY